MSTPNSDAEKVLQSQIVEELVEIDADGNVHVVGNAEVKREGKPTILHDPKGEYLSQ